jgi:COX assembly protein 2
MIALEQCHAQGFMWKAMGMCSDAKTQLSKCLRAERAKMQDANRSERSEKKDRVRQLWKEIDENS